MAKRRNVVGSVVKSKESGKPDYIKMRDGTTFSLENKASRLASLEQAVAGGKLSPEIAEEIKAKIDKTPDWVRFEIVQYVDKE